MAPGNPGICVGCGYHSATRDKDALCYTCWQEEQMQREMFPDSVQQGQEIGEE